MKKGGKDIFIGLDLGTSRLKGAAMGLRGEYVTTAKVEAPLKRLGGDRYELDAEEFYSSVCSLLTKLTSSIPKEYTICGISTACASGNTLLVGKSGRPLSQIIGWQDTRMKGKIGKVFPEFDMSGAHEIVGWPFSEMFSIAHLAWFKENRKKKYFSAEKYAMSTEFLNFRLTGKWGIDPSTAVPFYLVNQMEKCYHAPYLSMLSIPEDKLPPLMQANSILGRITSKGAKDTGLPEGTPLVLGTFDHPACARGAGITGRGKLLMSCGTSWVGFMAVKDRPRLIKAGMLADPYMREHGFWGGFFALTNIGQFIDTAVKSNFGKGVEAYRLFDAYAGAYLMSGKNEKATYVPPEKWDAALKGKNREERAFFIMKWACLITAKKLDEMRALGEEIKEFYMAGGPSSSPVFPQVMADTLMITVKCLGSEYTGAAGAALTASIGVGYFKDEKEAWKQRKNVFKEFGVTAGKHARRKLFDVYEHDRRTYLEELAGFLPLNIIDIHTHVWLTSFETGVKAESRGPAWPGLVARDNSISDLKATYELLFPGKTVTPVIFGTPDRSVVLEKANNHISDIMKKDGLPGFLLSLPEWSGKELERRVKSGGFFGLKPYLNFAPQSIASKDIEIFDFLPHHQLRAADNLGLAVILHIPRPGRLKDPVNLEQLLEIEARYPRVKLIVAHLGRTYCDEDVGDALKILGKTKNMSFDFSAHTNSNVMQRFLDAFGSGRLVFGSDLPITRMRMRRITENGRYMNIVPPGLYGDVSSDSSMREASAADAKKLTFFLYEELISMKKAFKSLGATDKDAEAVFHLNASRILAAKS